jgi:hypothetical protein
VTYFEWLARGPSGAEGVTLLFDIGVVFILTMCGLWCLAQAIKEAK